MSVRRENIRCESIKGEGIKREAKSIFLCKKESTVPPITILLQQTQMFIIHENFL